MFIRIYRPNENKELLINTNMIWKIEISYVLPDRAMSATRPV